MWNIFSCACLLSIYHLWWTLFKIFAYFPVELFGFLLLGLECSLSTPDTSSSWDTGFESTLSWFEACLSILLTKSLAEHTSFILLRSSLSLLSFYGQCLCCHVKTPCLYLTVSISTCKELPQYVSVAASMPMYKSSIVYLTIPCGDLAIQTCTMHQCRGK